MKNARSLAVEALIKVERSNAYSNLTLDRLLEQEAKTRSDGGHWRSEAAFASTLFYGVLERRLTLDCCIEKYADRGLAGMSCEVLQILRVSFYQLLFMCNIPESAVVNEAVKLAKSFRQGRAAGFVNGLLRAFLRDGRAMPHFDDPVREQSLLYSLPEWIIEEWQRQYGAQEAEQLASAFTRPMPLYARVNVMKNTPEELSALLREQLKPLMGHQWNDGAVTLEQELPACLRLTGVGSLRRIPAFLEGRFHIQDKSSQLCALSLGAEPGDRVLDLCAAPGGKSFTIAQCVGDSGQVDSFDLYEQRVRLVREGASRLGLTNVNAAVRDAAATPAPAAVYDRVLCDVPCSGLGILGRKPEIRYKDPAEFEGLPRLQYKILENAASYLRAGGTLVYSTCTLRQEENHQVTARFLQEHPEFSVAPFPEICGAFAGWEGEQTLLPHRHGTDGFYICRMIKR